MGKREVRGTPGLLLVDRFDPSGVPPEIADAQRRWPRAGAVGAVGAWDWFLGPTGGRQRACHGGAARPVQPDHQGGGRL
jgi:hypothetical protein